MKYLFSTLYLLASFNAYCEVPGSFTGELILENRYFLNEGAYGNSEQGDSSLVIRPEYSHSWDEDRKVVTFIPYARLSQLDDEKSHGDIRELSFVGSWERVELRAGISKVFWGVTESMHLVDVINQTDFVENPDGENKLGQPMINPTIITDYGNVDFFILPYFRERTFSGEKGRFRGAWIMDTDNPVYLDDDKENHIDYAFRWSHYYGPFEWGLSYFKGTDREPGFALTDNPGIIRPVYGQSEQVSLDLQYVYEDWLFKGEVLKKDSDINGNYLASVVGFEYTFSNIKSSGIDIGLLYEWLYDERHLDAPLPTGLDDASFIGTRVAFNDENSTELLLGGSIDHKRGKVALLRLEASRRINENWKWEVEANILSEPKAGSLFAQVREDDYVQFSLSYFW